jgi:hypothetical protein
MGLLGDGDDEDSDATSQQSTRAPRKYISLDADAPPDENNPDDADRKNTVMVTHTTRNLIMDTRTALLILGRGGGRENGVE